VPTLPLRIQDQDQDQEHEQEHEQERKSPILGFAAQHDNVTDA